MVFPFARHSFGARPRTPGQVPVQLKVELKAERVAMAFRLLSAYAFARPESEQYSSHPQIDCDRSRRQSSSQPSRPAVFYYSIRYCASRPERPSGHIEASRWLVRRAAQKTATYRILRSPKLAALMPSAGTINILNIDLRWFARVPPAPAFRTFARCRRAS